MIQLLILLGLLALIIEAWKFVVVGLALFGGLIWWVATAPPQPPRFETNKPHHELIKRYPDMSLHWNLEVRKYLEGKITSEELDEKDA
jgi:hypothetical protein